MIEVLAIAIGGALGSVSRYSLSKSIQALPFFQGFPLGILICNVLGSFLIGLCYGYFETKFSAGPALRAFIMVGFLGGFTTFSSFSLDTINLLHMGAIDLALTNIVVSVFACLLATVGGIYVALFF